MPNLALVRATPSAREPASAEAPAASAATAPAPVDLAEVFPDGVYGITEY